MPAARPGRTDFDRLDRGATLLIGVGGATFLVGKFEPVPVLASVGLALTTGLLARPVLSEVSTASISFVVADTAWRPALSWPVGISTLFTTAAIWGPRRFGRADPRAVGIVIGGAAFAVWASVPDTEIARALLGATFVVSLAAVIGERPIFTGPALGAFAGLFAWATMDGGSARVVSLFGAWLGLALMTVLGVDRLALSPTQWGKGPSGASAGARNERGRGVESPRDDLRTRSGTRHQATRGIGTRHHAREG
jgi:hypothetical protein